MYRSEAEVQEERTHRLLYGLFGLSMLLSIAICSVILFAVLVPEQGKRQLGDTTDFVVGQVAEVPVSRLDTSRLLPQAPNWSDDIIFVIKQPDYSYRAFLGIDPVTGCKLNWRDQANAFVDTACSQTNYSITGHNKSQPVTLSMQPQNMIELPVEVKDNTVYVIDRILRRDRR
jgi:hypothetical protein